jgi:general stress protein 26
MDIPKYEEIADYIRQNPVAIIGTIDDDGTPYGAVVYVCNDDHRPLVYFITKNGTRKYKNLAARPAVSLTITKPGETSTLQAKGQASLVRDAATLDMVTTRITRTHATAPEWLPPLAKLHAGEYTVIAIELTEARLANYKGKMIGEAGIFTEA